MSVAEAKPLVAPLPPRTRLYHLAPIGVGTAAVESLTGYLMRLAEAHCVPTSALISDELLPMLRPEGLGDLPPTSWAGRFGGHLNGTGELARDAVTSLARLTGRQNLAALTLTPWSAVMAPHGLQRRRAWCIACFAEALKQGKALYEPLLWAIRTVAVCSRHQMPLSERCPHEDCRRRLPILGAHARPGHCSWCKRMLVQPERGPDTPPLDRPPMSDTQMQWSCWVADQIGQLLAAGPAFMAMPLPSHVGEVIEAFAVALGKRHAGTHGAFARSVGIHANLIHRWRSDETLPTLPMLVRMSQALGISLVQLITGDTSALLTVETRRTSTAVAPQRVPREPPVALETAHLRQKMESLGVSKSWPPVSGAAAARQLGCSAAALCRSCPDEWHDLVMRYRAYRTNQREFRAQELAHDVRQAMLQLHVQGLYPSTKRILPLLHRRIHPRHAQFYIIRRQLLQELGWTPKPSTYQQGAQARRETARSSLHPLAIRPACPVPSS